MGLRKFFENFLKEDYNILLLCACIILLSLDSLDDLTGLFLIVF